MTEPLAPAAAARRILSETRRQPSLRVPLDDALGSVLAEDVVSPLDIPAWTNSAISSGSGSNTCALSDDMVRMEDRRWDGQDC